MLVEKFKNNWGIIKFVFILFILWKAAITIITLFGLQVIDHTLEPGISNWFSTGNAYITRWANWDGGHYLGIAENGYLSFQVVFFPLYPLLIKGLMLIGIKSFWGGLLISHLSAFCALFFLYKITLLDFEEKTAKFACFLLLAFPTSFYLTAVYNESLFLALALSAFYFARTKRYFIAYLLAGFSAATRLVGLFVIFGLIIEYYLPRLPKIEIKKLLSSSLIRIFLILLVFYSLFLLLPKALFKDYYLLGVFFALSEYLKYLLILIGSVLLITFLMKNIPFKKIFSLPSLYILIALIPLSLYLFYLNNTQKDPFIFIKHEKTWDRTLISPFKTITDNHALFVKNEAWFNGNNAQESLEYIFFLLFTAIFVYSITKLRLSYNLYFLASILIPISTGTFEAIHRYALIVFPIFIALATVKNNYLMNFWIYLSVMLLGLLSVMFINGLWVT